MKKLIIILGILCLIFLLGCSKEVEVQEERILTPAEIMMEVGYNLDDVAQHNSAEDCWVVINGKVYDITRLIPSHPEKESLLEGCGMDATDIIPIDRSKLPTYFLADLQ